MTAMKDQIRSRMTGAMKEGDKIRVGALRMLMAAITNREKEVLHELSDEEIAEVAGKEVKKRGESIEAFDAAGRTELADKERAERDVIAPYAPEQISEAELDAIIQEALAASGASSPKEMGKIMGLVMARAKGRVDGTAVQQKVRGMLGE
jgi:uncharacterized protein